MSQWPGDAGLTGNRGLYIFGFGGHARSVGDIALSSGIDALVFIDASVRPGESFGDHPAVVSLPDHPEPGWSGFPALGDNQRRRALYQTSALPKPALIAPSASIGRYSVIGEGTLVAHQAHVGPLARVGLGAIINSGAIVDHETQIGDFCHISVNATVAGRCTIGSNVFIGAGATVIDGIKVTDNVIVGAGATVVRDIDEPGVYVGTPARPIQR
jgi:UDP-N-acetylbacillosamine N-acetyltransferase